MNKSVIVLCKNHKCENNNKGDCRRAQISLAPDGSLIVSKMICEDAEEKPAKETDENFSNRERRI